MGTMKSAEAQDAPEPEAPEADNTRARRDGPALDALLQARLRVLCEEGWELQDRFDSEVRQHEFHPFVAADYQAVLDALVPLSEPGFRFLEWGSATGVIAIMADLLGFEAYGIEIDHRLVDQATDLARRTGSGARFTVGSFVPDGYRWKNPDGDHRLGTIGSGDSGYLQLRMPLDSFDVVFAYPWAGEEAMMLDLMRAHGRPNARLLLYTAVGVTAYQDGHVVTDERPPATTGGVLPGPAVLRLRASLDKHGGAR